MNKRQASPRTKRSFRRTGYSAFIAAVICSIVYVFIYTVSLLKEIERSTVTGILPTLETTYKGTKSVDEKKSIQSHPVNKLDVGLREDAFTTLSSRSGEIADSTSSNQVNKNQNFNNGEEGLKPHSVAEEKINGVASRPARYAYNYVLGGIHESEPSYKGFLYTILMSVSILKKLGSEADFWVWAQLSPNSTLDEIPDEEMRLFDALDIKVVQMEKPTYASFSSLMYDKFRALQKTEYKRFIYLDADILPLVNLDYYFHLSDPDEKSLPTILRPNMNIATRKAPCNGGIFMMHPAVGAWDQLADIVNTHREEVKKLEYPHFDFANGWGHDFEQAGDYWEGLNKNGTNWHFYGSVADQGLWYHYSKYVRKDVSIIVGDKIQTWIGDNTNSDLPAKLMKVYNGDLSKYSPEPITYSWNCDDPSKNCYTVDMNIAHFVSDYKPWMQGIKRVWWDRKNDTEALNDVQRLWFKELYELNKKLKLGLKVYQWNKKHMPTLGQHPPFGLKPSWKANAKDIQKGIKMVSDAHHRYTKLQQ